MLKLLIFLSILGILRECGAHEADKLCNCENVLGSYSYDDTAIRNLGQQVQLLSENLRLRLDLLTTRLDQQTEIIKELNLKLATHSSTTRNDEKDRVIFDSSAPLIDVRGAFVETAKPTETRNVNNNTCAVQQRLPANCAEATAVTRKSGLYKIQVDSLNQRPFLASCDEETQGGGWTVIQKRLDGSIDFYRNWTEYQEGFGNLEGEFFIGLDRLHALTTDTPQELLIVMEDFENAKKFAKYDAFAIGDEAEAYSLKVLGKFSGDAGDSLRSHVSAKWTTKDVDNDTTEGNCAVQYTGAWWYYKCHVSNLNGQYLRGAYPQEQFAKGIVWHTFRGYNYALKYVQMMIRPQKK